MNKQDIITLLATNDKAIARALVVLNERQTSDEQASENTKYHNGRGFRPCHARMGTSMAKFYAARGFLSTKQIAYWRKPMKNAPMKIAIYAGQLLEIAAAKATKVVAKMEETAYADVGNLMEEMMVVREMYDDAMAKGTQAEVAEYDARLVRPQDMIDEVRKVEAREAMENVRG